MWDRKGQASGAGHKNKRKRPETRKSELADKDMRRLWPAIHVAQEMAAGLAAGQILL
jgi:hypothetical protein